MHFKYRLLAIGGALLLLAYWMLVVAPKPHDASNQNIKLDAITPQEPVSVPAAKPKQPSVVAVNKKARESGNDFLAHLEASANPQDILLLLALRGSGNSDNLARLRSLLNHTSERAMVLYLIAQFKVDGEYAATVQELKALKAAAPDNAVVDDLLAQRAYDNGDTEQALYHLQQGGGATASNSYQIKYLDLIGKVYLDRNGYLTAEDFADIVGLSAAYTVPNLFFLTQACRENANQTAWVKACGARAGTLFDYGETALDRAVGARLAIEYLPGEVAIYNDYSEQRQAALITLEAELEEKLTTSGTMIAPQAWRNYLTIYAEQGEVAAMRYLVSLYI